LIEGHRHVTRTEIAPTCWGLESVVCFAISRSRKWPTTIDVNQSHYRQMETGGVRIDVHRAKKLAEKLDCSIDELL
jgi:hypothetical protein